MRILVLLILGLSLTFQGFSQLMDGIDQLSPFHDGLASVKKGNLWGFMDTKGEMVVDLRDDLVSSPAGAEWDLAGTELADYPVFREGRCLIRKEIDGIYYYGYIDKSGKEAIAPTYVNATNFQNIDPAGKVITPLFNERNYVPEKMRTSPPPITGKFLGNNLVAVQNEDQKWVIYEF